MAKLTTRNVNFHTNFEEASCKLHNLILKNLSEIENSKTAITTKRDLIEELIYKWEKSSHL